jgi:hypothetical protein
MYVDPSISAALLALNHDSQAARYSRSTSPPTRAVMSDHHTADVTSLISQSRDIQDGVDVIRRKLEDSEMADLRTSQYFETSVHCDLTLTHGQRSLKD